MKKIIAFTLFCMLCGVAPFARAAEVTLANTSVGYSLRVPEWGQKMEANTLQMFAARVVNDLLYVHDARATL